MKIEYERPWLYISGPYTKGDVAVNVKTAIEVADTLLRIGEVNLHILHPVVIVVPHLSHFWHMLHPKEYNYWISYDLEYIKKCDALYRIEGESSGADGEVAFAVKRDINIITTKGEYLEWLKEWFGRRDNEFKPKASEYRNLG